MARRLATPASRPVAAAQAAVALAAPHQRLRGNGGGTKCPKQAPAVAAAVAYAVENGGATGLCIRGLEQPGSGGGGGGGSSSSPPA